MTRRTQEERRTEAEKRLLAAAAELIAEVGPSKVTLVTIGDRAGYSRGLASHHFGSKSALMERLLDSVTTEFRERVLTAAESESLTGEALALIRAYFDELAGLHATNRARLVLWADASTNPSADARTAMRTADREFRAELSTRIRRGLADDADADALAAVIVGMLRGIALQAMLDDDVDLTACRREVERVLMGRLRR